MTFNISLIGNQFVGKTCIANAINGQNFDPSYVPTHGALMIKVPFHTTDNKTYWFYLWDTAGMEKYKSLAPVYYRDSNSALIVCDVTSRESFDSIKDWYKLYLDNVSGKNPIMLIGNKIDLAEQRQVSTEELANLATELKCLYIEVSAKESVNINKILSSIIGPLLEEKKKQENAIKSLQKEKKSSSCCG